MECFEQRGDAEKRSDNTGVWVKYEMCNEIFGALPGLSSCWVTCNIIEEGNKLTKCAGTSAYDAYAVYYGAKSITFSAGQTHGYIRAGFTSDLKDNEDFKNGFFVGLYPGSEIKIGDRMYLDMKYSIEDQFRIDIEGGGADLYKGNKKIQSWDNSNGGLYTRDPPNGMYYARIILHEKSSSVTVIDVTKNEALNKSAPTSINGSYTKDTDWSGIFHMSPAAGLWRQIPKPEAKGIGLSDIQTNNPNSPVISS